jgi:hypothetical protein
MALINCNDAQVVRPIRPVTAQIGTSTGACGRHLDPACHRYQSVFEFGRVHQPVPAERHEERLHYTPRLVQSIDHLRRPIHSRRQP